MEKIQERNFKLFTVPAIIAISVLLAGLPIALIPVVGAIIYIVLAVAALASALFLLVYDMYFFYRLSMDINAVCEGDGEENESYITAYALSLITLGIYKVYWIYKLAKRLKANAPRYGFKIAESGKDIAILTSLSFGYIGIWELIKNMNKIAKVYNQTGLAEVVGGVQ